MPDPLVDLLLVQIRCTDANRTDEGGPTAAKRPVFRLSPFRHDLVAALPPVGDSRRSTLLKRYSTDGTRLILFSRGNRVGSGVTSENFDGASPSLSFLHVGILSEPSPNVPTPRGLAVDVQIHDAAEPEGPRHLRCECSKNSNSQSYGEILNATIATGVPFSFLSTLPTLGTCPSFFLDLSLLAQRVNQSASYDPPGLMPVLATSDRIPADSNRDEAFTMSYADVRDSLQLRAAIMAVEDVNLCLARYINPPLLPTEPKVVTLENMFDDDVSTGDGKTRYEVYKQVVPDPLRPSFPSRRIHGVLKAGDESPTLFELPARRPSPEPGRHSGTASRTVSTSTPVIKTMRKRRRSRRASSAEVSDGDLDDFIDDDGDPFLSTGGLSSSKTSNGYLADGFVVDDRTRKPKVGETKDVFEDDEESAKSDLYSDVSDASETEESEAGDEGFDRDFVPRKRSRPSLLTMELR